MALACKVHTRYEAVVGTDEACLHHNGIYGDIFVNIIAYKRLELIVETGHPPPSSKKITGRVPIDLNIELRYN